MRVAIHVDDPLIEGPLDKVTQLYQKLGDHLKVRMGEPIGQSEWTRYLGSLYQRHGLLARALIWMEGRLLILV